MIASRGGAVGAGEVCGNVPKGSRGGSIAGGCGGARRYNGGTPDRERDRREEAGCWRNRQPRSQLSKTGSWPGCWPWSWSGVATAWSRRTPWRRRQGVFERRPSLVIASATLPGISELAVELRRRYPGLRVVLTCPGVVSCPIYPGVQCLRLPLPDEARGYDCAGDPRACHGGTGELLSGRAASRPLWSAGGVPVRCARACGSVPGRRW